VIYGSNDNAAELGRAVDRVRADLANLGRDASAAPEVPPAVTARIVSALRAAPPPEPSDPPVGNRVTGPSGRDHRAGRPVARIGAVAGTAAVLVAVGLGTVMLARTPSSNPGTGPTAQRITVSAPPPTVPLSESEIVGLLGQRPDLGALSDQQRRASCLSGLGYPAAETVLGARPVAVNGRPALLLVLAGDTPRDLAVLVVQPDCSSADTGLTADTQIRRP
jgi:hypothetical protein